MVSSLPFSEGGKSLFFFYQVQVLSLWLLCGRELKNKNFAFFVCLQRLFFCLEQWKKVGSTTLLFPSSSCSRNKVKGFCKLVKTTFFRFCSLFFDKITVFTHNLFSEYQKEYRLAEWKLQNINGKYWLQNIVFRGSQTF